MCGSLTYLEKDTPSQEQIKPSHKMQQSKIIQPKKKKRYFDQQGNVINDETLIQDAKLGKTIIRYEEIGGPDPR